MTIHLRGSHHPNECTHSRASRVLSIRLHARFVIFLEDLLEVDDFLMYVNCYEAHKLESMLAVSRR